MQKIIENFINITKINRCSYKTQKMQAYIINFAKNYGYEVKTDSAGNILVTKGNPKICLQAHYDMVCVGDAPNIEVEIKDGIIKAKNSSLGADNGMAIAMMLELIKEGIEAEFLFTNDEEVGLIGAKNLELTLQSKYLLNLDSEDEGAIFIGCAGGIDLKITKNLNKINANAKVYQVSVGNLPGGHSGIDIDKNIDNAILMLNFFLNKNNILAVGKYKGGEKINSIPANATAIVLANNLEFSEFVNVKELNNVNLDFFDNCYIKDVLDFPNGVLEYNSQFSVVESSSNLALINQEKSNLSIEVSMRSLDNNKLEQISLNAKKYWQNKGYNVEINDKYPGWKPQINEFTKIVQNSMQKIFNQSQNIVIHAGLECGILKQKYPNILFASIGPNIKYPHSTNEQCEIESVFKTYEAVLDIIKSVG